MNRVFVRVAGRTGALLARLGVLACLLPVAALLAPATAWATTPPPTVTISSPAKQLNATQELISGTVNPHGLSTSYEVWYAPATSTWCSSGETDPTGAVQTSSVTLQATDNNAHAVSVLVTGLTSGTQYCAELAATNSNSQTDVSRDPNDSSHPIVQITFTAGDPAVTTTNFNVTGPQQVTVQGTVATASQSTTYAVGYDLATSSWCETDGTSGTPAYQTQWVTLSDQSDDVARNVTVMIDPSTVVAPALQPNTEYCAGLVASNASSQTAGAQVVSAGDLQLFTTEPAVTTSTVESTSATSAQVSGTVNPDGVSTTYYAAYAPVSWDWCQSNGASGSPAGQTTPQSLGPQDLNAHAVTVDITGLQTGATYCMYLRSHSARLPDPDPDDGGQTYPELTVGVPTATTSDVSPDAPTTAVVTGSVAPAAQATTYDVMYDLQSSNWCQSAGTTGTPLQQPITAYQLPQVDDTTHDVSVHMTGLTPGADYCAVLAAQNGSNGQSGSPQSSFGTPIDFTAGIAPTAGGSQVTDETASTSAVTATANPEGQSTTYHIGYATAGSRWCNGGGGSPAGTTAEQPLTATDTSDHQVNATIAGLQGGTTYCAAVVATNNSGSTTGQPTTFIAGQPSAALTTMSTVSPSSETVSGTVNPTGQDTQYEVAYDDVTSPWCQNGGDPNSASDHTQPVDLGASDDTDHAVSVTLTGLHPGESYCAELVATNASASGASSSPSFTAGYPFTAETSGTENIADSSVTVDGVVNPAGLATTYWVAYDVQDSVWCSSEGAHGLPGQATTPVTLGAMDTADHDVAVSVTGLTTGTGYCAEVMARNSMGTVSGDQVSFTPGVSGGSGSGGTDTSGSGSGSTDTSGSGSGSGSTDTSGSGSGSSSSGSSGPARATVDTASIKTTATGVGVPVSCPASSANACRVTVTLTATESVRGNHRHTRSVLVGKTTATVAPGVERTLAVSLNFAGWQLLRFRGTLKLRLSATQSGSSLASRTLTLRARRSRGTGSGGAWHDHPASLADGALS